MASWPFEFERADHSGQRRAFGGPPKMIGFVGEEQKIGRRPWLAEKAGRQSIFPGKGDESMSIFGAIFGAARVPPETYVVEAVLFTAWSVGLEG